MTNKNRPCDEDSEEDYERVFDYFDQNQKGYLDKEDILKVMLEMNHSLSKEDLDILFDFFDFKKTGKISFIEFY